MKMILLMLVAMLVLITEVYADEAWRSMGTAPRDGTVIEIKNNYGIAPWYGIFHYGGKMKIEQCPSVPLRDENGTVVGASTRWPCANPEITEVDAGNRWVSASKPGSSLDPADERKFQWRPYQPVGDKYVDPTGGAQLTNEYWHSAVERERKGKWRWW